MIRVILQGTTDGSGDLTVNHGNSVQGKLYAVQTILGTFAAGVDITLTCEHPSLSKPLLTKANFNADGMYYPRDLVHKVEDGAALTGTSGGDRCLPIVDGTPKMVIAQGGATKTGGCILYLLED